MILYDILLDGFQTPLTREEICELFHAGRIKRRDACKAAAKSEWRTIDELFPLLKYDSAARLKPVKTETHGITKWIPVGLAFAAVATIAVLFCAVALSTHGPEIARTHSATGNVPSATQDTKSSAPDSVVATAFASITAPQSTSQPQLRIGSSVASQPNAVQPRYNNVEAERERQEQERLAREKSQREQAALAQRMRTENQRQEAERQRTAGHDIIIPLDADRLIDLAGSSVTIKVHDNDVTSIDYWINGAWYRDVKKDKGITGSRTDETLLYRHDRASLY